MKRKKEIIYAFIDSQNLNLAIRGLGWKLDFKRFRVYLKEKLNVEKAFLFIGYISTNQELYTSLKQSGFRLVFKPVLESRKKDNNIIKGNIDAELVLHTMIEYQNFDKAIIVSGDGDFYCLIDYLRKKKKLLKLIVPNRKKYSRLLKKFEKESIYLNNFKNKLSYKKQTTPRACSGVLPGH